MRNANQKNVTTIPAQNNASTMGLVIWKPPTVAIGLNMKSSMDGAGYPQPVKMWQPPAAADARS